MDVGQAATALEVKRSAIRKAIARGRLRATLVPGGRGGAAYDIEPDALAEYERTRQARSGPVTIVTDETLRPA